MGFRQGGGSEKLLECKSCGEPLALDAEFCPECGVPRSIATGYEASIQKNLPTFISESDDNSTRYHDERPDEESSAYRIKELNQNRVPKFAEFRILLSDRSDAFNSLLIRKKRIIFATTLGMFFITGYVLIQTTIFSSQFTDPFSERYLQAVASRDVTSVNSQPELFPNPNNLPILPIKYQQWSDVEQVTWQTLAKWNGWMGSGTVKFTPSINHISSLDNSFSIRTKAKFKSKWGIFREIEWVSANPIATFQMPSDLDKDQNISINGVSAGNSSSLEIKNQEYVVLPGPMKILLSGKGFTKPRSYEDFVRASGRVAPVFESLGFELTPAQENSAQSKLEAALKTCLKSGCGRLPRLSESDFEFSNWPDSYLYVDYFNTSWGASPSCGAPDFNVSSINHAQITLSCTASAGGYIKWILYRLLFTTYYDTDYSTKTVSLTVSADLAPVTNSTHVNVSRIEISG